MKFVTHFLYYLIIIKIITNIKFGSVFKNLEIINSSLLELISPSLPTSVCLMVK